MTYGFSFVFPLRGGALKSSGLFSTGKAHTAAGGLDVCDIVTGDDTQEEGSFSICNKEISLDFDCFCPQ